MLILGLMPRGACCASDGTGGEHHDGCCPSILMIPLRFRRRRRAFPRRADGLRDHFTGARLVLERANTPAPGPIDQNFDGQARVMGLPSKRKRVPSAAHQVEPGVAERARGPRGPADLRKATSGLRSWPNAFGIRTASVPAPSLSKPAQRCCVPLADSSNGSDGSSDGQHRHTRGATTRNGRASMLTCPG